MYRCFTPCFILLLLCLQAWGAPAMAESQAADEAPRQWRLATFGDTGLEAVRSALHARSEYRELQDWAKPPHEPLRERLALEPLRQGKPPLVIVFYEGLFVCGSHGCPMLLLEQDKTDKWREVFSVLAYPGQVGIGPGEAHGFKDLTFPGLAIDNGTCPVWRHNGRKYDLLRRMTSDEEPCRTLNQALQEEAEALR